MASEAQRLAGIKRMAEWWASAVDALLQEWIPAMEKSDPRTLAIVCAGMAGLLRQMHMFFAVGAKLALAAAPPGTEVAAVAAVKKSEGMANDAMDGIRAQATAKLPLPGGPTSPSSLN
jgi:hypothetical protein